MEYVVYGLQNQNYVTVRRGVVEAASTYSTVGYGVERKDDDKIRRRN